MKKMIAVFIALLVFTFVGCASETATEEQATEYQVTTVSMNVPDVTIDGMSMTMDEYVTGVICVELQNWFEPECFKAFAIAARTNAVRRLNQGKELIDSTSFQCFMSKTELKELWGDDFAFYYNIAYSAALETHNMIVVDQQGKPVDAMYHALSSGQTEDSFYVTGVETSHLKGVDSHWDEKISCFEHKRFISYDDLETKYGLKKPKFKVVSQTASGNPYEYEVCSKTYTATELMYKLYLRSNVFKVNNLEDGIEFTTYGYGHGLGMSAYGANGMAKEGKTYLQILNHFYTDIRVVRY